MTDDTVRDGLARALFAARLADGDYPDGTGVWDDVPEDWREACQVLADAALAYLAEPLALANAAEGIRGTESAVEIAGLRFEECDTYGETATPDLIAQAVELALVTDVAVDALADALTYALAGDPDSAARRLTALVEMFHEEDE